MLAGMTTVLRGLAWSVPWVFVLACTTKPGTPPPTTGGDTKEQPGGGETQAPALEGRTFLSQKVTEGGKDRPLVEGTQLLLSFEKGSRLGAHAGCNSMSGRYAITDGKLVIPDMMQTERVCEGRLEQEAWYGKILRSSPSITVDGNTLVLEGGGVRIEYLDRKIATPDLELVGPTWTVDTIITKDAASHAAWPKPATLVFGADGKVQVFAGCNGGAGTYRVSGKELTFESVGLTEKACEDPLVNELETAVSALFRSPQPITWEITVDRLSLRGKDGGLDLVGKKG